MNLYLVSQNVNTEYDTYDSFVIACETETEAKESHPSGYCRFNYNNDKWMMEVSDGCEESADYGAWTSPVFVTVKLIGIADEGAEKGVIIASFNAG